MNIELITWIRGGYGERLTVPARLRPLWYHNRGLMQTATGYGRKLSTEYQALINNRWRRVYACQFSNAGTLYIGKPGAWEYVIDELPAR